MVLAQEFRRYASVCRQAARDTHDLESKANWNELAERWDHCAELEEARRSRDRIDGHQHRRDRRFVFRQAS
jgi:acid phosphatase class B